MNNVYVIFVVLVAFAFAGVWALRNVTLNIEPTTTIERSQTALFRCSYELEGEHLYSVKWYQRQSEFYRYVPSDVPTGKIFPLPGLNVDPELSDDHQVVLYIHNMDLNLSGEFSCEVTTDGPIFSTAMASRNLSVVDFPNYPPTLKTERNQYRLGDRVQANCTSAESSPAAILILSINNKTIPTTHEHQVSVPKNLFVSQASVDFQLFPSHLRDGAVYLHCLAQTTKLYQQDTSLRLDILKDSVSEENDHVHGTTTEIKTDFSAEGKGFNCVESICENGTGYPYQHIENVIKKFDQLNIFGPGKRGSYVPQNRIITPHVGNENVLCDVYTIAKFPQIMKNESNVQKYIVNDGFYKQGVVFEICVNKSKCSPAEFPEGYQSECVQKYTKVRLLAINIDDGEPEFNDFIIPSTCVCTFKKPFLH